MAIKTFTCEIYIKLLTNVYIIW